jgi:zinc resistance-associated protein
LAWQLLYEDFNSNRFLKIKIFKSSVTLIFLRRVQMKKEAKGIMVLMVVAIFGIATLAFAGWGRGYGYMMGPGGGGPGWHHGSGYGYNQQGYYGNLSDEEIANLDQQRTEFLRETDNIRQQLYDKELDLRNELAKEDPDTGKASALQSEISRLQSELDQKRIDFQIQARKSAPGYNRGFRGYGPMAGNGPMMGYGPRGGGYCSRW